MCRSCGRAARAQDAVNESGQSIRFLDDHARVRLLLGVGQLNRRKGFHVLIPALALVRDAGLDFCCTIVGDGAERPALEKQLDEHRLRDNVTLVGALLHEQVHEQLRAADTFVLPCVISEDGWRDGIPVALMEAMHNRVPVISTNILGLPELIEDQVSGLLVAPNNPEQLAHAILRLAGNPALCRQLGAGGRDKVLQDFNNDKSAAALQGLIEAA